MQQLVGGLIGLILAMLMETILLIIRTSVSPRSRAEETLLRHDRELQEAKLTKQRARQVEEAMKGSTAAEGDVSTSVTTVAEHIESKKEQ